MTTQTQLALPDTDDADDEIIGAQSFEFQPGYVIIDMSTASGGVHYDREKIYVKAQGENGEETAKRVIKHVDHVEMCKTIDACVQRANTILAANCAKTTIGWFADKKVIRRVSRAIEALQAEARALNARAEAEDCARRAYISIVPAKLELSNKAAANEIARTVRTILVELRDALRRGEIDVEPILRRCRNLHLLAPGMQGDIIRFALDGAKAARKEIKAKIEAGDDPQTVGKAAKLGAIQNALDLFTPYGEGLEGENAAENAAGAP